MKQPGKNEEIERLLAMNPNEIEALSYESAMVHLEVVVQALEKEGTQLDMGLKLYELGTALSRKCGQVLDKTEERMVQLLGGQGPGKEENFDPEKDGR